MTAQCPVCFAEQAAGLLCSNCTDRLEHDLGDIVAIVAELDVTISKQARIGSGGKGGLARERMPLNVGAMQVADDLQNTLTTWARDVGGEWQPDQDRLVVARAKAQPFVGPFHRQCPHPSCDRMRVVLIDPAPPMLTQVAAYLLSNIEVIRKHAAVDELADEITEAIRRARQVVDRPADRQYLGTCLAEFEGVTCTEEVWARPGAKEVTCRVCGVCHEVAERRAWLLKRAEDMLCTVKEASSYLGEVGDIRVTEASIRGYLHRGKRLAYRPGTNLIRLGDLLAVVLDDSERKAS